MAVVEEAAEAEHLLLLQEPLAVREATAVHAPDIQLVRQIFARLRIIHNQHGYVTFKRLNTILTAHPDLLKKMDTTVHDMVHFIGEQYPTTRVKTSRITAPPSHVNRDEEETWIVHGIVEVDRSYPDA